MANDDIYRVLQLVVDEVFQKDTFQIRPELSAKDVPGWDSFRQVSLIMAIESRFQIEFLELDMDGLVNIESLAQVVASKTKLFKS